MNSLISVIIPVYNSEKYVERCLESIISQTHENLEILVIDDGSEDHSAEIITQYVQKDPRIVALHQENQGVSAARNRGLSICTGNLIGFIDADDEAENDMYEFLYHNLLKYGADISHCGLALVKPNVTINFHGTGEVLVQDRLEGISEILSGVRVEPSTCNKLYTKSVLQNVYFPLHIKTNEDLLFNIEAFMNAEKTVFEDRTKYKYFSNSASASRTRFTIKKAQDVHDVAKKIKEILVGEPFRSGAERFYAVKLLTILQGLHTERLYRSHFAQQLRKEVSNTDITHFGLRARTLKIVLVTFPFLYSAFRTVYDLFYPNNQKWKNH